MNEPEYDHKKSYTAHRCRQSPTMFHSPRLHSTHLNSQYNKSSTPFNRFFSANDRYNGISFRRNRRDYYLQRSPPSIQPLTGWESTRRPTRIDLQRSQPGPANHDLEISIHGSIVGWQNGSRQYSS